MPIIAFPKEYVEGEKRCSVLPANVKAYRRLGADVVVEAGVGAHIHISDEEYAEAGAKVESNRAALLGSADVVMTLHKLGTNDLDLLSDRNPLTISFLDPFNEKGYLNSLLEKRITAISMEMIHVVPAVRRWMR